MHTPTLIFAAVLAVAPAGDPSAIARGLMDRYLDAWAHADPAALGAAYATAGTFTNPAGARFVGPAEIAGFYGAAFARGYAGRGASAQVAEARAEGADGVSARGTWRIEADARPDRAAPAECGTFAMTARREAGVWKAVSLEEIAGVCAEAR